VGAEHDVDVRQSWAYSDSVFDVPLLNAVRNPTAVNPDPRLRVIATLRRWPTLHLDAPPGVPKVAGVEPFMALRPFMRRRRTRTPASTSTAPSAAAHRSGDRRRQPPQLLRHGCGVAHRRPQRAAAPLPRQGRGVRRADRRQMAKAMGGIRVERGTGSDEPLWAAARALAAGELVAMMPQGTIPRGRAFFEPELQGRWGAAKLAATSGAPVIPIGIWGTEKVWPRSAKLPNVTNLVRPPLVTIRVGEPVAGLTGDDVDGDTRRIMAAIADLLPPEARERREPTDAELAATFPDGRIPADGGDAELHRRPGTD
jgi:putative phosphoserine phosphatase/1-acylglycerol-3-phosphate O-acyltransferase